MVEQAQNIQIFFDLMNGLLGPKTEGVILKKNMPIFVKKLSCFMACVIKSENNENSVKYLLPIVLKKNKEWKNILNTFNNKTKNEDYIKKHQEDCCEYFIDENYYYKFTIEDYGFLILGRKKPFEKFFKFELKPVINFLGKSLSLAVERKKLKNSQKQISREKQLLRTIIDNIPLHVYVKDLNNKRLLSNKTEINYFGLEKEEDVIGKKHEELFKNIKISDYIRKDKHVYTGESIINKDVIHYKNGEKLWFLHSKIPLKNEKEEITGLVGIAINITERKRIEETILSKQKMLQGIAKATDELIKNSNLNDAIKNCLAILGDTVDVDRTYLFKNAINSKGELFISQTHLCVKKGEDRHSYFAEEMQNVPFSIFDHYLDPISKREPFEVNIKNVAKNSKAKGILDSFNIKSVAIAPIFLDNKFWGLIGYDNFTKEKKWSEDEFSVMKSFGNSFSNALERIESLQKLEDMALFPQQNPNPVIRINLKSEVILENKPAKILKNIKSTNLGNSINTDKKLYKFLSKNLTPKNYIKEFELTVKQKRYIATAQLSAKRKHINIHFSNITEQKKVEEKYRNLISNMNLGLIEVGLDDKIQFSNKSFEKTVGYSFDEIKGKNVKELLITKEFHALIDENRKNRILGYSNSYETLVKDKSGKMIWLLISAAPNYNDKGEVIGTIAVQLNITKQKKLEKDLEIALQKSQKNSEAKEIFLANMSHEIRTPLNGIIGMIRALNKGQINPPQQKENVIRAMKASKHLLSVVNNILDITKIEAGEYKLNYNHFCVSNLMNDVFTILKPQVENKNIDFVLETFSSPEYFIGDESRIRQVLINIVGNSIKFTEKGSVVLKSTISATNKTRKRICFTISDTGIGMDKSYLNVLFDKFQQEDATTTRKYEGTGLGMFISKELIDLMGGDIEVTSKKGVGTEFKVYLPLQIGNKSKIINRELDNHSNSLQDSKILLVEDIEMNRLVACNTLNLWTRNIVAVSNGLEAIEILKKEKFDVILMDIQMPDMNGIDATKIIRNELKLKTPIIALSANAFKSEIDKCLSIGMNDYITKPFEERDLFNVLIKYINNEEDSSSYSDKNYDLTKLIEMSRGNQDFVKKMLQLFVDTIPDSLQTMNDMLNNKNIEGVRKIAHRIKPSLLNMGITVLKDDILEIESFDQKKSAIPKLINLVNKVTQILNEVVLDLQKTKLTK